jgi:hypothetical protein
MDLYSETVSFCEVFKISKPKEQLKVRESIMKKVSNQYQDGYRIRSNETQNS